MTDISSMGSAELDGPLPGGACKQEEVHILERGDASVKMIRREVRGFLQKSFVILVAFRESYRERLT